MKNLLFLIGILLSLASSANDSIPKRQWGFRLSYDVIGTQINYIGVTPLAKPSVSRTINFLNFGFSFQVFDKKTHRSFHDIAISRITFNTQNPTTELFPPNSSGSISNLQIGVRYGYNQRLGRKDKKSQFYLEFPVELFYFHSNYTPFNAVSFPIYNKGFGFNTGITPRFQYYFLKQAYFDLAIPISVFNGMLSFSNMLNPNTPLSARK